MDEFDFSVEFEVREEYLYAFVSGEKDSLEVSKKFYEQISAKALELGIWRILVEENFPNQVSYDEMFLVAEYAAGLFPRGVKLAHVDRHIKDVEMNRVGAAVALDSALLARVFDNSEEAIQWLLQ